MDMKKCSILFIIMSLAVLSNGVLAAPISITTTENWAGGTMHGITPSGSGTVASPYVYIIPQGIALSSSGVITTNTDKYVTFDFSSGTGGLSMTSGRYFNLTGSTRQSDPGQFKLILGANSVTGSGDFKTTDITKDSMDLIITGSGSVSVNSIYMRTSDAFTGSVEIDIGGTLSVSSIDTSDRASGGNTGGNVTIRAAAMTIGAIDTRTFRTSGRTSGSVVLEASGYTGTNTISNTLTLNGLINTNAPADSSDGSVSISGVVDTLGSGFSADTGIGSINIYAGMVQYGKLASQLFIKNSGGSYTAIHNVPWTSPEAEFYASAPNPGYLAGNVHPEAVLGWTPGTCAVEHDVYLGTDYDAVNNASNPNVLPGRGRQSLTSYNPEGLLEFGVRYYWRIDEICTNPANTWRGAIWTFTTDDCKAQSIHPTNGISCVPPDVTLAWSPGIFSTSYDVYFGTDSTQVNTADNTWPVGSSVYKGHQESNEYDIGLLDPDTTYYWRIDAIGSSTFVKGDVWSFKTAAINVIDHAIVYYQLGKFAAWPANNGILWNWGGNEIVVGFEQSDFACISGHNSTGPSYNVLARSLDSGTSWTTFNPSNFVGDTTSLTTSPGVNFAHPNFAMRINNNEYYVSYDRCATWQGRYRMSPFGNTTVDSWVNTSRTDYIVNGPNDCLVFMSASVDGGMPGPDRAYCARTTDGGITFQFQGWIVPPSDPYRAVMSSTVRCSSTKLVSALRRRDMDQACVAWIDIYVSNDNGVTWSFLSKVGDTGCENGNPPALTRLADGRLCCVYGNRIDMRMYMKYSENEGASWGPQITLRDDWADCAGDRQDLGYPRITQTADGRIVCVYYWSTPERIENHIVATVWDTRNSGCIVDIQHLANFAGHWLEQVCNAGNNYCSGADLNQLNGVNEVDLSLFADQWLRACPYGWPWP